MSQNTPGSYLPGAAIARGVAAPLTDETSGTAGNTIAAVSDPADAPASADALRDDLATNTLPSLRNSLARLTARVNALLGKTS